MANETKTVYPDTDNHPVENAQFAITHKPWSNHKCDLHFWCVGCGKGFKFRLWQKHSSVSDELCVTYGNPKPAVLEKYKTGLLWWYMTTEQRIAVEKSVCITCYKERSNEGKD